MQLGWRAQRPGAPLCRAALLCMRGALKRHRAAASVREERCPCSAKSNSHWQMLP